MKSSKPEGPGKVFRILIVDDNRNGLLARKSVLQEHGYVVDSYSSPEEALAQFKQQAYDLVVTDYRMPKMTGSELITEIRRIKPEIPIVLISSMVDALGLCEKTTGADVVIPKSSTEVTHLIRAVKRLLESHTPKKPVRSQADRKPKKRAAGTEERSERLPASFGGQHFKQRTFETEHKKGAVTNTAPSTSLL
jgi:CheY-like chemotaxis protein